MLLTIATTHRPATDLGYLLHKHPDRVHRAELSFGQACVVYGEATPERCAATLFVEIDPIALIRDRDRRDRVPSLAEYVNDRPYVASSMLAAAVTKLYGTALTGRSKERQELADTPIPLELHLPVVSCRGGEELARRLFEPLGYAVDVEALPLDEAFPSWGPSRYLSLRLTGTLPVREALEHVVVLVPVLDTDKHYRFGDDEVDKLLRRSTGWLASHPERVLVTRRYLRHDQRLVRTALRRLAEVEDTTADVDVAAAASDAAEAVTEAPLRLNDQRLAAVVGALRERGCRRVVDLGCGQGRLVQALLKEPWVDHVTGIDVSWRALETAARRLRLDTMAPRQRERLDLRQGALTYRDRSLVGVDGAALVEVIEHLDASRLGALERVVFAHARPGTVVVTTPNVEYNVRFPGMAPGALRHRDHRFEWDRATFAAWATGVAERHGYTVRFAPIGPDDPEVGPPTQMAVFAR